jgi:cyclopropane-fatty-acyl-phospholipid synthase
MSSIFEPQSFAVLDVENLRLHYAQTLRHWLERYEVSVDRVRALFDERFVRAWRLYLAGSIAAFSIGTLELYQVLVSRAGSRWVPWTRDDIYRDVSPRSHHGRGLAGPERVDQAGAR